jgi:hypothetical protein
MDGMYGRNERNGAIEGLLTSESHDRACFLAGDPLTLTLALDVCGEPTSSRSRSRSSQAYTERIGGNDDDAGGGGGSGWAVYDVLYRAAESRSNDESLRGYVEGGGAG